MKSAFIISINKFVWTVMNSRAVVASALTFKTPALSVITDLKDAKEGRE
jgi:hypothetical protein